MRILIFHGYLLRGTGSNIYNAQLAQALARLGHEVHLLCQDRDASRLRWVDAVGSWERGALSTEPLRSETAAGSVTVYTPEIDGLLPVYVADSYEGFEARPFPELSEAELERYLAANVAAVGDVIEAAGAPDAALANHLVMGPAILARAGIEFAAKVHGSALEYTVKPHPRFLPLAREGMDAAAAVLVGSRHTAESLWAALGSPEIERKTRLGPPGLDSMALRPRPSAQAGEAIASLAERVGADAGSAFGRDGRRARDALEALARGDGPRVIFVGKLIVSKGIDLLLAAWPLVHDQHPRARLLVVGFGELDEASGRFVEALGRGDLGELRAFARSGRGLEGGEEAPLPILSAFLEDPPQRYLDAARACAGSIAFSGRLEHDEVTAFLPFADALVMPSTFPEAFGMVAAEAAACGALPISAAHSGMREVSAALAVAMPKGRADLLAFEASEGAVEAIADRLRRWLSLPEAERRAIGEALASRAAELWSWDRVAQGVIAASRGDLGALAEVSKT